jgi:hypothetical protein
MKTLCAFVFFAVAFFAPGRAVAGDFDGSKVLICAPVEAIDCAPGEACTKNVPANVGVPAFIRIDMAKKAIIGPKRTTPIVAMEKSDEQILLQGSELGTAWTVALDQETGKMSGSLVNREEVFVLFGSCTPL